jgi:hypothetical protein
MGLDIVLMKVVRSQDIEDKHKISTDFILGESPELEPFKDFGEVTVNSYWAIDKVLAELGYESSDVEWLCDGSLSEYEDYIRFVGQFERASNPLTKEAFDELPKDEYGYVDIHVYLNKDNKAVELINPPLYDKEDIYIPCIEIGYQRKGANKTFYSDDMWDSPCVLSKSVLEEHWIKYFSHTEDDKEHFKEHILDKFIDGETFVCYC